jgi:23S rRNA pseudouridine2457 synthase
MNLPPTTSSRLLRFNKPYGVLSQFTPEGRWRGLKDFIDLPGVYVAGRLDADSEGLLLLTDDGKLQARIADPRFKMEKTYWVQVEGVPSDEALAALRRACSSTTARRALPGRACSTRRPRCGTASPPSASARAFPPRGWSWRSAKAATARCGA